MTHTLRGKCSWFGGPDDTGVSASEDLAFWEEWSDVVDDGAEHLFLPKQPPNTTGLARRLNPEKFYIATRWDYDRPNESKAELVKHTALVRAPKTGREYEVYPADWGPNENTGRIADISPGLMDALGITTDDEVVVTYPYRAIEAEEEGTSTDVSIVISSGHSLKCPGAEGPSPWGLDEVTEARKVTDRVADELRMLGAKVVVFHDDKSTSVSQNLDTICAAHNGETRDIDVSTHFNASDGEGHGVEVLYLTQEALAARLSAAIAKAGKLTDRGPKYRDDLKFLKATSEPAVMLEVAFVDNKNDVELYRANFTAICLAVAEVLASS